MERKEKINRSPFFSFLYCRVDICFKLFINLRKSAIKGTRKKNSVQFHFLNSHILTVLRFFLKKKVKNFDQMSMRYN